MDVRRSGDAEAATLSWDKAAGVTSWDVRVSRRPSARAAYAAEDERSLPASETTVALELAGAADPRAPARPGQRGPAAAAGAHLRPHARQLERALAAPRDRVVMPAQGGGGAWPDAPPA